jgi:ATP-dependent Clp protease ATP-binding subunit ClpB
MFEPLSRNDIKQIVKLQLDIISERLGENNIKLSWTEDALDWLSQLGYDPQFGARPLKRVLQKRILDELSKKMLSGELQSNGNIVLDAFGTELVFRSENEPA